MTDEAHLAHAQVTTWDDVMGMIVGREVLWLLAARARRAPFSA